MIVGGIKFPQIKNIFGSHLDFPPIVSYNLSKNNKRRIQMNKLAIVVGIVIILGYITIAKMVVNVGKQVIEKQNDYVSDIMKELK